MAHYWYRGRDSQGLAVEGRLEAASIDALVGRLHNEAITPTAIEEQILPANFYVAKSHGRWRREQVQMTDLIMFSRQMYSLSKAGVPILRAISGLAETTLCPPLRRALHKIHEDLISGIELAAALGRHDQLFSLLYISLIHIGENTGHLDQAFDQCSRYLEMEWQTRNRIKEALRYPVIVLTAMLLALAVVNLKVVPAFAGLFASFHGQLPLPTRIIMASSEFFMQAWPWLLLATAIAAGFMQRWLKTETGRERWDGWILRWPLIGSILYRATLARFARAFASCQRSGVPLSSALGIVANSVGNCFVGRHIKQMREGIERGDTISHTAQNTRMFSPLVIQMLSVGEESGRIDHLLDEVAEFYEREVDYELKQLASLIEPVLIVGLGIMVLVLALGIFLPMWELSHLARGG